MKVTIKFLMFSLLLLIMTSCRVYTITDNREFVDVTNTYGSDKTIYTHNNEDSKCSSKNHDIDKSEQTCPGYITIQDRQFCILETEVALRTSDLTSEDLEPLRYMTNLTSLSLGAGSLIAVMDYVLNASDEQYSYSYGSASDLIPLDITPLAGLTSLTHLELTGVLIFDISPLADLTNLTTLNLEINGISDITPLAGLTNLTRLDIGVNPIDDLSPLSNLNSLEILTLCGFLTDTTFDLEPLRSLTNLSYLRIRSRQLECRDITPLAGLVSLQSLDLSHNQISDLAPLRYLTNLEELSVGDNQIRDLAPLAGLTNIDFIGAGNNQISDLTVLTNLCSNSFLWLQGNPITDWSPVEHIGQVIGRPNP